MFMNNNKNNNNNNNNDDDNNNNSKKQYFHVKKQTLIQSKSACPSILNVKRPTGDLYIYISK